MRNSSFLLLKSLFFLSSFENGFNLKLDRTYIPGLIFHYGCQCYFFDSFGVFLEWQIHQTCNFAIHSHINQCLFFLAKQCRHIRSSLSQTAWLYWLMCWLVVKTKELFYFKFNIQIHFLVHIKLYRISVNELTFLLLKRKLLFVGLLAVLEFQVEGRNFLQLS